ncbi:MAG: hypothetical protein FWF90_09675 [Promicromonosporaceae bacterium]|nr:hypothetical protein [Promicromonosporaceae bacterium]
MTRERAMPRVEATLRAWVPGWALRVLAALAGVATLLLALHGSPLAADWVRAFVVFGVVIAAWTLARPTHAPALVTVMLVAVVLLTTPERTAATSALWLAPLAYVTFRLSSWAGLVRWTARVELGALGRSAWRDAVVIAATLLLAAVALLVSGTSVAGLVVGALALLALALVVLLPQDATHD